MTDYSELVKALRCCGSTSADCTVCPWDKYTFGMCAEKLLMDAADAIEALQAKVKDAFDEGYNFGYMAGIGCCSFKRAKQPPQEVQE